MITTTLTRKVESSNKFQWRHWRFYANYNKAWLRELTQALKANVTAERFHRVHIVSYRKMMLDDANFRGGCKPIPDSLKKLGYIVDDNDKELLVTYQQVKSKEVKTVIMVGQVDDAELREFVDSHRPINSDESINVEAVLRTVLHRFVDQPLTIGNIEVICKLSCISIAALLDRTLCSH